MMLWVIYFNLFDEIDESTGCSWEDRIGEK